MQRKATTSTWKKLQEGAGVTNDEAIKLLVNIAAYDIDSQRGEEKFEALWMAIKALERQNGAWKKDGYYLECSCCGYKIEADDLEMNNYCSACGAKMT